MTVPEPNMEPPVAASSSRGCAMPAYMPSVYQRRNLRARSTGNPAKHTQPTRPLRARAKQQDIAVAIRDLQVEFARGSERSLVLKGVDLEIKRGTLHMLLGPNGCGKSTLLKVLGGLVSPSAGTFDSEQPTGFVFQNPDHQVVMPTVAADVAFGLGRYDLPEEQVHAAVASALEVVNMSPYMYRATHTLSGGQRQRVAIAGALAENPRILLLDELTTFLDMEDQFGVLEAVKGVTHRQSPVNLAGDSSSSSSSDSNGTVGSDSNQHPSQQQQRGSTGEQAGGVVGPANSFVLKTAGEQQQSQAPAVTAIWVTHRFEELDYADTVSYMHDGRVAFTGTPTEMRAYLKRLGAPV